MSKLVINPLVSGFPSVATLNANFEAIEAALENTVSRDGTTPNHLTADLDMNGHRILNELAQEGQGFIWKDSWTTSTEYVLNNLIKYNGDVYICTEAHTSGTWATDLAAGKWTLLVEKPTAIGGGDLLAANNLDDVDDFTVARANLLAAKSGVNSDITSLTALNEATFKSTYNMEAGVDYLGYVAPGTANNVLTSTGSGWASSSLFALISMSTDPGYIKFQNGLLVQWGLKSSFSGSSTLSLPYAYSNTNYGVFLSVNSSDAVSAQNCYVRGRSAGSINLYNTATFAVHWLTIGQAA